MKTSPISKRLNHWYIFPLFILVAMLGCGGKPDKAATDFGNGRTLMTQGYWHDAIPRLTTFLNENPQHSLSARATFLLGKCHLGLSEFDEAERGFEKTIQDYPETEEAHNAAFKLAMIELLRDKPVAAQQKFEKIAVDGNGPYSPETAALSRYLLIQQARLGLDQDPEAP